MTYYDDGLPDEAFTELERAAGVPALMRGRSSAKAPAEPTAEIEPSVGQTQLISTMVDGICKGGLDVWVEARVPLTPDSQYDLHAFTDWPDHPLPNLYLKIAHDIEVPITYMIDAQRRNRVPLFTDEETWLAWDAGEACLKTAPKSLEWLWSRARAERPIESMEDRELQLVRLLRNAVLSCDHGKKPLLLRRGSLDDAMARRMVEFEAPRRIAVKHVREYVLSFYDSAGQARYVPLADVAELGFPIFTRFGAYHLYCTDGDLVPFLNSARLLVGAFRIATSCNPNQFDFYLAREQGTIFHSAIERIESPRDPDARAPSRWVISSRDSGKQTYVTYWDKEDALHNARSISDWSASQRGTVYITGGEHPLDAKAVTTPELYLQALTTLAQFGYTARYNLLDGVTINKTAGESAASF